MDDDFKNNEIIEEMKTLIDAAEKYKAEIDAYCKFMKGVFLGTSGLN